MKVALYDIRIKGRRGKFKATEYESVAEAVTALGEERVLNSINYVSQLAARSKVHQEFWRSRSGRKQ